MNQYKSLRQLSTTRILSYYPATPDHRPDHPSLQNYHGPVKVSQTSLNIQDLLQGHSLCSKPIKTFSGFILILASPGHQRHHPSFHISPWATQSFPEPSWSTKSTIEPPTLLQIHSNLSRLLHVYRSHSRPSLSSHITRPVETYKTTPED